jgi:hypothetical protein
MIAQKEDKRVAELELDRIEFFVDIKSLCLKFFWKFLIMWNFLKIYVGAWNFLQLFLMQNFCFKFVELIFCSFFADANFSKIFVSVKIPAKFNKLKM